MQENKKYILIILALVVLIGCLFFYFNSKKSKTPVPPENIDVLTYHYDNIRSGANTKEKILTPENVNSKSFGKLFSMTVDGDVYAQPLYKGGTLFVATEHDSVYAFNSTDGTLLWKDSFINPAQGITAVPAADVKTYDIYPELGITGTPVIDGATDTLYVVSEYKQNIAGSSKYVQTFHALDLISGKEKFGGPTVIVSSSTDKSGKITSFDALLGLQRSALLLNNGVVYIAWASNGDHGPYHGWVIAYQANNIQNQLGVFNDTKNGKQGGIWMSGGGISSDGKYLYAAIGNGTFDPDNGDYGDSVIKFVLGGQKQFNILDYFSPYDQAYLDSKDLDLGTSEVLVLPKEKSSQTGLTLLTADKAGTIYVLDSDNLGKFNAVKDAVMQEIKSGAPLLNNLAYFNNNFYVGSQKMPLQAFTLKNDMFKKSSQTKAVFDLGVNPIVSSNGTKNSILWALDDSSFKTYGPAVLHAYNAGDLSHELYNSAQEGTRDQAASAVKFTAPLIVNGFVYVPGDKEVDVYGLLNK